MKVPPDERTYRVINSCRICSSRDLEMVVSLGVTPLANAFLPPDRLVDPEPRFPLEAMRCGRCGLVQLSVVVRPKIMFADYAYMTSAAEPAIVHFDELASELVQRFSLRDTLVVEIGSNDGVLLAALQRRGAHPLGVEPAENLAAAANARGLQTVVGYFSASLARDLVAKRGRAKLIVANNVLAHIDDLHGVLEGLGTLLDDDGVCIAEFPYLEDLLSRVEYDTIYHEHLSYFALSPLVTLFAYAGMEVFDVRRLPVHGGSLRIYVGRASRHAVSQRVAGAMETERARGLLAPETYRRFGEQVSASRSALRSMLGGLSRGGRTIAALGATAKGNTLLNYCEIGPDTIAFIADSTPLKQGRLTPGMHIPVRPEDAILAERPEYTLLLAWNYADSIMSRYAAYTAAGGRFIHPVPIARVLP